METASFLDLPDGRRLAYHLTDGRLPGVVFLGGFKSDMTGTKATTVEAFCKKEGIRCLRFDYTGHGQSSGEFINGTIGAWKQDALDMLDRIAPGKNILVGSSLGAWLMVLAALERKKNVAGMVGLASAPDFTEWRIWRVLNDEQKQQIQKEGVIYVPACDGEPPYPITRLLIEEARKHMVLNGDIVLDIPVRLLHGTKDEDVPWDMAVKLMECIKSTDISLELIKDGGHRLSEPRHLELICQAIQKIMPSSQ